MQRSNWGSCDIPILLEDVATTARLNSDANPEVSRV